MDEVRLRLRRDSFLIGRWAAKALLKRTQPALQHLPYPKILINGDLHGSMRLMTDTQSLPGCLSLSTSGRQAFCAVTFREDLPIGVALEHVHPRADAFQTDYFNRLEIQELRVYPATAQNAWLALAWSIKSALIAAMDAEIRVDAREIILSLPNLLSAKNPMQQWLPAKLNAAPGGAEGWRVFWQLRGEYVFSIVVWMGKLSSFEPHIKEILLIDQT